LIFTVSCGHFVVDSFYPKRVETSVTVDSDREYSVEIEGEFVYLDLMCGAVLKGFTSVGEVMESDLEKLGEEGKCVKVEHLGDRDFDINFYSSGTLSSLNVKILNSVNILPEEEYLVRVIVPGIATAQKRTELYSKLETEFEEEKEKYSKEKLDKYNRCLEYMPNEIEVLREKYKVTDLYLNVSTDAEVIEHNAQSEPWFFGLIGGYEWHVTSPDDPQPYILLKLDTPAPKTESQNKGAVFRNNTAFHECQRGFRPVQLFENFTTLKDNGDTL